jgi:hypothetical protein
MRPKKIIKKDPLGGLTGVLAKFFFAALFGGMVSLLVFFVFFLLWGDFYEFIKFTYDSAWFHLLWVVPVIWGILGIIWFDQMLEIASSFVEYVLGLKN